MAETPIKTTNVKYVNKDFESFKRDLMRYAQAHFSGSFQDYNEASPGMMILETQAYIADILAFYMDQQFLEMKKETSRQIENVQAFAKMRGYKPKGNRAAIVPVKFLIEIPANGGKPDPRYLPVLRAGTQVGGPNGTIFELLDDVDFSAATAEVTGSRWVTTNGTKQAIAYAVRAQGDCVGARTVSEVIPVGDFVAYRKIPLSNTDVIDVINVKDEQGNTWYEVDYLVQNAVLDQVVNTAADVATVPYVLRYRSAARRFVVERDIATNSVALQFGAANGLQYNDELIPNVANLALPIAGRLTFNQTPLDPQNFIKTSTMGLSPFNTKLLVRYRIGGGEQTNVPARSINKVITAYFNDFGDRADAAWATKVNAIKSSIECVNLEDAEGGGPPETISEIKANADGYFAAQGRAVSKDDYLTHVFSLPERFGRVAKAYVTPNEFNPYAVDLHVLCLDSRGWLVPATETLQKNIKTYFQKLRMVTEGINILDAAVINVGVNFGVVISPQFNRSQVLVNCLSAMKEYLKTDNLSIGQPLVLSDMQAVLQNISGVISVYKFDIVSFFGDAHGTGRLYNSSYARAFDVSGNTKNGIVYCPTDAVFEVRYPDLDIVGESK